jgi:hypothetical protein
LERGPTGPATQRQFRICTWQVITSRMQSTWRVWKAQCHRRRTAAEMLRGGGEAEALPGALVPPEVSRALMVALRIGLIPAVAIREGHRLGRGDVRAGTGSARAKVSALAGDRTVGTPWKRFEARFLRYDATK